MSATATARAITTPTKGVVRVRHTDRTKKEQEDLFAGLHEFSVTQVGAAFMGLVSEEIPGGFGSRDQTTVRRIMRTVLDRLNKDYR